MAYIGILPGLAWCESRRRYFSTKPRRESAHIVAEASTENITRDISSFPVEESVLKTLKISRQKVDQACAICSETESHEKQSSVILNCRHKFHPTCLKKWLTIRGSCPMCRACVDVALDVAARCADQYV